MVPPALGSAAPDKSELAESGAAHGCESWLPYGESDQAWHPEAGASHVARAPCRVLGRASGGTVFYHGAGLRESGGHAVLVTGWLIAGSLRRVKGLAGRRGCWSATAWSPSLEEVLQHALKRSLRPGGLRRHPVRSNCIPGPSFVRDQCTFWRNETAEKGLVKQRLPVPAMAGSVENPEDSPFAV